MSKEPLKLLGDNLENSMQLRRIVDNEIGFLFATPDPVEDMDEIVDNVIYQLKRWVEEGRPNDYMGSSV